jgi:hypothetical protein
MLTACKRSACDLAAWQQALQQVLCCRLDVGCPGVRASQGVLVHQPMAAPDVLGSLLQEDNPDLQDQLAASTAGYKDLTAMVRRTAINSRGSGEYGSPR